jgi:hypothetical protein
MLLGMVNMGVHVEISVCEVVWGEQQQKTSDFLRHFISFERHIFAGRFLGP